MYDEKYMCFADFEFTCGEQITRMKSEMLSIGLVICDSNYVIVDKYYSTSKPNLFPVLQKRCCDLTHLTQEEIDRSADSEIVLGRAVRLMQKYRINKLRVWGNFDRLGLISDVKQHRKFGKGYRNIKTIQNSICDIQQNMVKKMQLPEAVNIQELATAFGYTPENGCFHNALIDAMALYTVHKSVYTTNFSSRPEFIKLAESRRKRIENARFAIDENRRKAAFAVPLTESEKAIFDILDEKQKNQFIYIRCNILKAMKKYPDATDFLYVKYPKKLIIIPKEKYDPEKCVGSLEVKFFSAKNFSDFIIETAQQT
ncbi:MAG: hypothetical protein K2I00_08275 [Ruminococcus sp.]|nr:hypothetical protein [Ruminococcus sp.]